MIHFWFITLEQLNLFLFKKTELESFLNLYFLFIFSNLNLKPDGRAVKFVRI